MEDIKKEVIKFAKIQKEIHKAAIEIEDKKEDKIGEWFMGYLEGQKMAWERLLYFFEIEEWKRMKK